MPASRREQAKNDRRDRIIDAADDLMREVGFDEISVRMIADRAEVSPATVYNLFHNKSAVLYRLYQRRVAILEQSVDDTKSVDALEHIFDAAARVASLYRQHPAFYRAFIGLRLDLRPDNLPHRDPPGVHLWRRLAREALAAGELVPQADTDLLGSLLFRIITGSFYEWVGNVMSLDRMEDETEYSLATVLKAWAAPSAQKRLDSHIAAASARVSTKAPRLRSLQLAE
jgi:AcrR family transcriptional regulator